MNAMPHPRQDRSEAAAPSPYRAENMASASTASLADAISTQADAPPPHLLWATLESAYATPEQRPVATGDERLAPYIALPIAIGLSLVLWVVIVELVLMR